MSATATRPQLRIVRHTEESKWGSLRVATLTRASIAEATDLSSENGVLIDSLEMLVCAAMRAAELFPDWARDQLSGREDAIDGLARLLVAGNPGDSHWAAALLCSMQRGSAAELDR